MHEIEILNVLMNFKNNFEVIYTTTHTKGRNSYTGNRQWSWY